MNKYLMNRMANAGNIFQGKHKRVLCVCSAGLLRSPTAALVLSQPPYNYNTRAAGLVNEFALIPVDEVLIHWADEIVCMDELQEKVLLNITDKPIISLNIPNSFGYRSKELISMIEKNYNDHLKSLKNV